MVRRRAGDAVADLAIWTCWRQVLAELAPVPLMDLPQEADVLRYIKADETTCLILVSKHVNARIRRPRRPVLQPQTVRGDGVVS